MVYDVSDLIYSTVAFTEEDKEVFARYFRAIAGASLESCKDYNGFFEECGLQLTGDNEQLTREIYLDCINIMNADSGNEIPVSNVRSVPLATSKGVKGIKASAEEVADYLKYLMGVDDSDIQSETEEVEETSWGNYGDEIEEEVEDKDTETEESEDKKSDEDEFGFLDEDSKEQPKEDVSDKELREKIRNYYGQYTKGVVDEMVKRYSSLFESGYEVVKPAGILSYRGLIGLSGSSLVVKNSSVSVSSIYRLLQERTGIIEVESRSNINIGNTIYTSYCNGGRDILYFSNKLLEYAYGRKAPKGDNQDSANTYEPHADEANWESYKNNEVKKSLSAVVSSSIIRFVISRGINGDYFSNDIIDDLRDYLEYVKKCLSNCLLMVEYKCVGSGDTEELSAFKLRVCDPSNSLGNDNITDDIIKLAFMGATGEVPFSYAPRFEPDVFIKEYAHEFNHDSAQAMPLFSYKAYESLQKQGVVPTWDRMILGMFEDGTILINGKKGVSLDANLTHQICAGSRAGKGVMTLNILVSGLLSRKVPFYLDRKPDMASMLKNLSPEMFVVNGGAYNPKDDNYKTFSNIDSLITSQNVPDYLCSSLNIPKTWEGLGDIFYLRALTLVMGIIMARGKGYRVKQELGGDNGIMLIVDEFKNFQESFSSIVKKMMSILPASMDLYARSLAEARKLSEKGNDAELCMKEEQIAISYNDGGFYALSFLNALVEDVKRMSELRDASFDPAEIGSSDVFVIGQSLKHGAIDVSKFEDMLKAGRYKSVGRVGVTSGANKSDLATESFAFSMVDFKKSDAFFGRNMEDGRSVYLAQTNTGSKAYGRLDDKASNFAYLSSFTDEVRRKIVNGGVSDNVSIANSCIYFKPFLVLNDAVQGDTYTEQMFSRCAGPNTNNPWVTREQIIAENPNGDGSFINYAVGFKGYLDMVGAGDYSNILKQGSDVANFVVKNCLGYNGTWLQFITDLRPEWIFTVGDVMDGINYYYTGVDSSKPKLLDPSTNPILSEFYKFNPSMFSDVGTVEEDSIENYMDSELEEDIRNEEFNMLFEGDIVSNNMTEADILGEDDEVDIYEDDDEESSRAETVESILAGSGASVGDIASIVHQLNQLGYEVRPKTVAEEEFSKDSSVGNDLFTSSVESCYDEDIKFNIGNEEESLENLMELITNDVVKKFGGYGRISELRVIGGVIVVNGSAYKCTLSDKARRRLPQDLAREVATGNVSKLFDYRTIHRMTRIRELEFDSVSFTYDYVAYGMGYGNNISVESFFRDLPSLQKLCVGKKLFTRQGYKEQIQGDDVYYKCRLSTRLANFSEDILGRFSDKSWEFTKNTMNSKKYGKIMKFVGVTGGTAVTVAAKTGEVGIKGGRKLLGGIKTLGNSIRNVFDEIDNF